MPNIRKASLQQMPQIQSVYEYARGYMASTGNPNQWGTTHPRVEVLQEHILNGDLYVIEENDRICGCFAFIPGVDPTYGYIEGSWHSDEPYAAIHCVAGNGKIKGMFSHVVRYCQQHCSNLRIDTYKDNHIMQHLVIKHGFSYCGIIYLSNGSPRLAYDKQI